MLTTWALILTLIGANHGSITLVRGFDTERHCNQAAGAWLLSVAPENDTTERRAACVEVTGSAIGE